MDKFDQITSFKTDPDLHFSAGYGYLDKLCKNSEQEGLEPPTLSGSRFQGGVFIQPGLLQARSVCILLPEAGRTGLVTR